MFSSNLSDPLSCGSTSDTVKKRISGGFIALAVTLPSLTILVTASTLCFIRRTKASARTDSTVADAQQQPEILSTQEPPPLADLTNQIRRLGEHPTACGGYSDVYTALWHRNNEVHQPTSGQMDIPMTLQNNCKVAIKVLRLSSVDDDEVEKKNKVRAAYMPCLLLI
jgi:hypothetical protein